MANDRNTVYDNDIIITMRGTTDSIGLPYTVNPLELVDREAIIELQQGPQGPAGPAGEPAWPWEWQGDIADLPALRALRLTAADARKAWRVISEQAVYYWTGLEFIAFTAAFGKTGPPGRANTLTGSAVAGPPGSAATARVIGTAPGQQLEITFPRGDVGDVGDPGVAGRIQDAADVLIDATHVLAQDYVLAWNTALNRFVPSPSPRLGGPWAIGQGQFSGGTGLNDPTKVLAVITIPGQPMAWRPMVNGWVNIRTEGDRAQSKCDIEVRIGGPDGDLVGYGHGVSDPNFGGAVISPEFQNPLSPTSPFGVVAANLTVTLYVIARRVFGAARYSVRPNDAQLIVYADPV
ncbi:hypothetical protein [Nocardia arthritidis]|uniref:Uncharacterized protein n=1 Tax=Nocardia arthritidis TaxID=228602 RepID=A0A6G9YTZ5_9NOCA|nr:hypothetical protein [Nocardia arthritidis]QIS16571.1 hypothetical protein F5544_43840 [Nocardia arthritidis]